MATLHLAQSAMQQRARQHFAWFGPPSNGSYIYPCWLCGERGGWVMLLREQIPTGVGHFRLTLPAFFGVFLRIRNKLYVCKTTFFLGLGYKTYL
jgi:hypothetical protein